MKFEIIEERYTKKDAPIKFIENFCINLIQEIKQYYYDLEENPLKYRERTLSSVVFPAFMRTGRRAVMEVYYRKNNKRNFLDYYIMDSMGENSYLVEFKHGWYDGGSNKIIEFNANKWNIVNEQIEKLKNEQECVNEFIDSEKNIYGLSMYMIVSQSDEKNQFFNYDEHKKIIIEKFEDCEWIFVKKLADEHGLSELDGLYYLSITLIGKICEIEKNN